MNTTSESSPSASLPGSLSYRLLAALLIALCATPAFAALSNLLSSGVDGEVWTYSQDVFRLENIKLRTPRDFSAEPHQSLFEFSGYPAPPRFEQIHQIVLNPLSTEYSGSRPEFMEYYPLGEVRNPMPAPPDWQRKAGQIPPWTRTQATADTTHLPFLNHAIFCWTAPGDSQSGRGGVYLFRQAIDLQDTQTLVRAILRVASNAEPIEAALNENPLHMGGQQAFSIVEFEVTPLLREGVNIFSIKIRQPPGAPGVQHGLAFHLELTRRPAQVSAPELRPGMALVTGDQGDCVWGWINQLRGDGILLDTPYGLHRLAWDECTGVLLPWGWHSPPENGGILARLISQPAPATLPAPRGLPLLTLPDPLQDRLLLTEDRTATAKPSYAVEGTLYVEGFEGKRYPIPLDQVLGIYPPQPVSLIYKRPDPSAAVLYCEVRTTAGELVSGLLRQLDSAHAVLETSAGQMLDIKPKWISTIRFPYHAMAIPPGVSQGRIALIPQISGQEAYQAAYLKDARLTQLASFSLGIECENIPAEILADPAGLTPQAYSVLVMVDPLGEYLHTLNQPADAQQALVDYVDKGGILIALSRGGAFRTAVRNQNGRFIRSPASLIEPSLNDELGIRTIRPIDSDTGNIAAFDHPPNFAEEFFFQRMGQLPEGLEGLSRRITLSRMLSAPFFPMVGKNSQASDIYILSDTTGATYGPALSLVPRGKGYVIVIDHLLWESQADGHPFGERMLPVLLRWGLLNARN